MNSGILTSTGQPARQGAFLHCRQRAASIRAVSAGYPNGTSRKFFTRSAADCSGMPLARDTFL